MMDFKKMEDGFRLILEGMGENPDREGLVDTTFFGASIIWWNGAFGFSTGAAVAWVYYLSRRWERFAPAAAKK